MDYENDVKHQKGMLDLEEKRIMLSNKDPKLARKLFDKMQMVQEIKLRNDAKRDVLKKFK